MEQQGKKGIDVSAYQGTIDWEKVANSEIEFAMIRMGYGQAHADAQGKRNLYECNRLGIPCGVYWFSYALNSGQAAQEAAECLRMIRGFQVKYVAYDLEYDSVSYAKEHGVTIGPALATAFAQSFCNEVRKGGYEPLVYANWYYVNHMFRWNEIDAGLWYARYQNEPDREDVDIWQYTNAGNVPGIEGKVDLDMAMKAFDELQMDTACPEIWDVYNSVEECPGWAQPTVKKLIDTGALKGNVDGNLCLTYTALKVLVIQDRMGLYGEN